MDNDNRLSYFFLGLGMGVAAGMLFAPKSGEATREFLRQKADDSAEFMKRRGEGLRESASEYVEKGRTALSQQRDNISAAMDAGKAAYREAVGGEGGAPGRSPSEAEGI